MPEDDNSITIPIPAVFEERLVALHAYFGTENSSGYLEEDLIYKLAEHRYNPGFAHAEIRWLLANGYLREFEISRGINDPDSRCWEFTPGAAEYIHDHVDMRTDARIKGTDDELDQIVPAADRFVTLNHNSPEYAEAQSAVDELTEAVRGSNDLFANPDEKLAILSEMEDLRSRLKRSVIRVASIWQPLQMNGAIGWLAKEAGAGVIRDLAIKAFNALSALVGHIFSGTT